MCSNVYWVLAQENCNNTLQYTHIYGLFKIFEVDIFYLAVKSV